MDIFIQALFEVMKHHLLFFKQICPSQAENFSILKYSPLFNKIIITIHTAYEIAILFEGST